MIRTTTNTICCLLFQASLPATYWAEALHTATYLLNRFPSKAVSHPTPHFALYGTTPSYDHLRVFDCACYPNTSATAPNKLFPRSTRCLFLGYSPGHKGYRCLDLTSHRIIISRHVVFDEDVFPLAGSIPPTDLDSLLESDPVPPTPGAPPCAITCTSCGHDATARAHSRATRGPVDPACAPRGHACATRGPVDPACATRGPVDHACATRGPDDPACATRGPVDPGSLRRPCARLPPSRPRRYLGACRLGPVDAHDPLCRPRRRLSPPQAGHTRRSRRSGGPLRAVSVPPGRHPPRPQARPPDGDSARRWRSSPR
jgi:hypothetical protein